MRLDPFYQPHAPAVLGLAYYMLKRYPEGLPHLQEGALRAPNMVGFHEWLAATCAQLGRLDTARAEAAEVLRIDPYFTIEQSIIIASLKRPGDVQHLWNGLHGAGLPER
jgi:adenylate cyclase